MPDKKLKEKIEPIKQYLPQQKGTLTSSLTSFMTKGIRPVHSMGI